MVYYFFRTLLATLSAAFAFIVAAFSFTGDSESAAWTLPYGKTKVIKTYSVYTTEFTNIFTTNNGSGSTTYINKERFFKAEFTPLVEVGASHDLTIGVSPSLQHLTAIDGNGFATNWGLASTDIYFRYKLWEQGSSVFSVQPLVKISGVYDEGDRVSLGAQQFDYEMRGLFGHSFQHNYRWQYLNMEAAYRKRLEAPGDEFMADLTMGYRFYRDMIIMPQIFSVFAVGNSDNADIISTNSNDYDLVKLQLSFVQEINKTDSVQLGLYSHYYSRNTGGGGGMLVSFWKSF